MKREEEDLVCIFLGVNAPVLLRKRKGMDGAFRLAGTGYLHGIMAGEALRLVRDGTVEVRTFSIA
jgi:hypothetical protein